MYFGQAFGTAAGAALLGAVGTPAGYTWLVAISIPLFALSIALSLAIDRKPK
jgi:hypothetical protein